MSQATVRHLAVLAEYLETRAPAGAWSEEVRKMLRALGDTE